MNYGGDISIQKYANAATKDFNECENRLSEIEGSFQTRMNGKTTRGLIGAMFGTACWYGVFCVFYWYIRRCIDDTVWLICFGISLALIVSMFIDEFISFSYYRKIASYNHDIVQLKNRVNIGRSSIKSNQDSFMNSRSNGWHYPLSVGSSILEEATFIERTINGMESLKGGFINGLKNFLFFTFTVAFTVAGSWALFETAEGIIYRIDGVYVGGSSSNNLQIWCVCGLIITIVCEIFLAKIVWSKTDCAVTNITLFAAAVGPVLFLTVAAIEILLVKLAVWTVSIVIFILGFVAVGATLFASTSGG